MTKKHQRQLEQSASIVEQVHLRPFQVIRRDTGQPVWLVQSRSTPDRYYLLTVEDQDIRCPCQHAQHRGMCAHAAAVRRLLLARQTDQRTTTLQVSAHEPSVVFQDGNLKPCTSKERQQREEAERRERALPWTDDKPFSMWKS